MFILNSDISIGKAGVNQFRFTGVHEVRIKRSIHNYTDTATIQLPSIATLFTKNNSSNPQKVITGKQWNDGDPVTIKLGYNNEMHEEFRGFIKYRDINMPLEIECEGYAYQLRRNSITKYWRTITVADLLKQAVINTDITVQCNADVKLHNVRANKNTGAQLIDMIHTMTDDTLSIFFIEPTVLWCGLTYTPYANNNDPFVTGSVQYRLGYNLVKDHNIKERTIDNDPMVQVYSKRLPTGEQLSAQSDPYKSELVKLFRKKILNHVSSKDLLKILAQEKATRKNYAGYEGKLTAFLQPFTLPGHKAYITDARYKERDGTYLVESTEVIYGIHGARRIIEIGPRIGFATT